MTATINGAPVAPADVVDERHVLGCMMYSAEATAYAREHLTGAHFAHLAHKAIFDALLAIVDRGVPHDIDTIQTSLLTELIARGEFDRVGRGSYLLDIQAAAPTATDVGWYVRRITARASLRGLAIAGERLKQLAETEVDLDVAEQVDEVLDRAATVLDEVTGAPRGRAVLDIAEVYPALDWAAIWDTVPDEPDWLVEPIIERGRLYALFSKAGTGKSLLSLEIAAALATGRPVLGNPGRDPIHVLYVDLENSPTDLVERLSAFGYGPADLGNLHYLSFPSLPALDSPTGGLHLLAAREHYRAEFVAIDTVSRVVAGKENENDTWNALYRCALAPLKAQGVTVLRLDHMGKDAEKGQRGGSAKDGDVDLVWQLEQVTAVAYRLINDRKHRNNHHPERIDLERRFSPLRHQITRETGLDPAVAELVEHLDRLGVPVEYGRPKATAVLTADGIRGSATNIQAAVNYRRKTCSEQVGGE